MATPFSIVRLTQLPTSLAPNSLYIVKAPGTNDVALTWTGNSASDIGFSYSQAKADGDITAALAGSKSVFIFGNIAEKDAEVPLVDSIGFVKDATADPTVLTPSAFYIFEVATARWSLATSGGSGAVNWDDIVDGPEATPAQIDEAVAASHVHANQAVLDKIGVDADNRLTYDDALVSSVTVEADW